MVGSISTGPDPALFFPTPAADPIPVKVQEKTEAKPESVKNAPKDEKSRLNAAAEQADSLQKLVEQLGYQVTYGIYEGTSEFYAKITDPKTDKVIRMIPPEEWLKLSANIGEVVGRILDKEA